MELRFRNQSTDIQPSVDHAGNKVIYRWEVKGKETEIAENNMPRIGEVCQMVAVTFLKSWAQFADLIWYLFNKNIVISPEMKTKIAEITKNHNLLREKIQSVIKYIQDEYRYV